MPWRFGTITMIVLQVDDPHQPSRAKRDQYEGEQELRKHRRGRAAYGSTVNAAKVKLPRLGRRCHAGASGEHGCQPGDRRQQQPFRS